MNETKQVTELRLALSTAQETRNKTHRRLELASKAWNDAGYALWDIEKALDNARKVSV